MYAFNDALSNWWISLGCLAGSRAPLCSFFCVHPTHRFDFLRKDHLYLDDCKLVARVDISGYGHGPNMTKHIQYLLSTSHTINYTNNSTCKIIVTLCHIMSHSFTNVIPVHPISSNVLQVVTWGEKIFTANQPLTELGAGGAGARVLRLAASQRAFAALLEDGHRVSKRWWWWGKSHGVTEKSPFGKISIFNGKITIFNGKITIFNGKISIFNGKISIFNGKITMFNGKSPFLPSGKLT